MGLFEKLLRKVYPDVPPDPVKHCQIYKTVGCVHVDGMLCDMRTCNAKLDVTITVDKIDIHDKK